MVCYFFFQKKSVPFAFGKEKISIPFVCAGRGQMIMNVS